ncbi:MAG: Uma2 family endonuclease [Sphingomonadaceae bacterium]|nr:Uma2 family endonuclease [Sphingomonadaceae bacterium]
MTALRKWDEPRPVKLTIDDFLRLDETEAFRDYAKTELIEGVIFAMNAQYSAHAHAKTLLLRRLADAVDKVLPGYVTWSEVSVAIPPGNLPEPDLVVTNFRPSPRAPVPAETIALVVEVADTTAAFDLGQKAGVYARATIAEYWVVDLDAGAIRQLWEPGTEGYGQQKTIALGEPIAAITMKGLKIETTGLR